ncbi:MAG: hypothetical protein UT53_C0005G0002 [Candidatus Yanofskybacteria bacterium GW2011_GWD2_39_48]|uniref:Uncharacterized protein n=1 Tax=Candidatus Yanofskybacteria bacterium GW2011_GWD2_39_48 TaxID=1619031 RepID=A0A0G0PF98_9BACT|nr:MAG: hypothetical protein UT53_C0005G0002 [Candidatus Yanofskybacteria bacterium GW2011_GWD2_39_48]
MSNERTFPESLNNHVLGSQDGLAGSIAINTYSLAIRDYMRGERDAGLMEKLSEAQRFLRIILPRDVLKARKNVLGRINGHKIAIRACHIRDYGHRSKWAYLYTESDLEKLKEYDRRCKASLAVVSKILRGRTAVSSLEVEATQSLFNDLHDVFWSMHLAERHRPDIE